MRKKPKKFINLQLIYFIMFILALSCGFVGWKSTFPTQMRPVRRTWGRLHKGWSYDLALRRAFVLTCGVTSPDACRMYARRWSRLHQLDVRSHNYDRLTTDFHTQILSHNSMNSKFACFGLSANCFENTANTKAKIAKSLEN